MHSSGWSSDQRKRIILIYTIFLDVIVQPLEVNAHLSGILRFALNFFFFALVKNNWAGVHSIVAQITSDFFSSRSYHLYTYIYTSCAADVAWTSLLSCPTGGSRHTVTGRLSTQQSWWRSAGGCVGATRSVRCNNQDMERGESRLDMFVHADDVFTKWDMLLDWCFFFFRWCLMFSDVGWHIRDKLNQCVSTVQYSFTSTETMRLVRTENPGQPPRLSHSSW